jgi:N6-L-threonylcarbamoyladenine synthase
MRVLGIETSCDETGASVFEDGRVLSNVVLSQEIHRRFGGVVPEVASRQHVKAIVPITRRALEDARADLASLDCVAVTVGPGLIGSLIVGVAFAKSLCLATGKPLVGVDHIECHIAAVYIAYGEIGRPSICLVASGGHTHLFRVEPDMSSALLGSTADDAAGESFDKVARMLGLDYPGGPEIEREASRGDPGAIAFPRAVMPGAYDFSFSGLKTAVKYFIDRYRGEIGAAVRADVAASFQQAAVDVLVEKTVRAALDGNVKTISAVGGVAANTALRAALAREGERAGLEVLLPPKELCTDNGAIVAAAGYLEFRKGAPLRPPVSPYSTGSFRGWRRAPGVA